ncbi:MAG: threonine dehydratase [Gemmatimonadota bacterium]|nr:threonine dehydratase [Gemmatimonadota bacterium]
MITDSLPRLTPDLPIALADIHAARDRIRPFVPVSPLREYPELNTEVGRGIRVFVKHENHNPVNTFKVRNGMSFMTALPREDRARGIVAATRGNHGLGLAWSGARLGVPVTICVPVGNSPEKNAGMRSLGATLIEQGEDYDAAITVAEALVRERGLRMAHSTNDQTIIAGAGTLSLEMLEQQPELDAVVIAIGGGSQAVGALTAARALRPSVRVFGVQAEGASATHDSWHAGHPVARDSAKTFADGLATRSAYEMTFPALLAGLAGFITVSDAQIAEALRLLLRTTHNLAEGAGAAGLAGLLALRDTLAGQRVGVVISGGNIDSDTLRRVLAREI